MLFGDAVRRYGSYAVLKDASFRTKTKVRVDLQLEDRSTLDGFVFCGQGERISDILNDAREFLPFETHTKDIMMLRKGIISSIVTREDSGKKKLVTDPFEVLGIPPGSSRDEIRQAYHQKVRLYHPDKLTSLDLPEDITSYASDTLARINSAYDIVMRKMGAETPDDSRATA